MAETLGFPVPLPQRFRPLSITCPGFLTTCRLDRLDPTARAVAQVGATIGREFSHELLAAVAGPDPAGLAAALDRLAAAGLVFRRGEGAEAGYLFKHALVRDAAYGTLLRDRRRALHAAIARALEKRRKAGTADGPETVAHHLTEAGLPGPAATWWLEAGLLAAARSAYVEAVRDLRRGLDVLADVPPTRERAGRELGLWRALGAALAVVRGYAGPEVGGAFGRALTLCRELGDDHGIFRCCTGSGCTASTAPSTPPPARPRASSWSARSGGRTRASS